MAQPRTTFAVTVIAVTEKAIFALVDGDRTWVPRSVCKDGDYLDVGDCDIEVENWWLRKEGML